MASRNEAVRGSAVRLRRCLRTRVVAACTLFFAGLSIVLCFVLPRSFEALARDGLRDRTQSLARVAAFVATSRGGDGADLAELGLWLRKEPEFDSIAILDSRGRVRSAWPVGADGWGAAVPAAEITEGDDHFVAVAPIDGAGRDVAVAVRTSTARLRSERASIAAMHLALLLLAAASLFVLISYLVRAVLAPLEEIHQAARHLSEGELHVTVPRSGDAEIDELGGLISRLGDERRENLSSAAEGLELASRSGADLPASPGERRRGERRRTTDPAPE